MARGENIYIAEQLEMVIAAATMKNKLVKALESRNLKKAVGKTVVVYRLPDGGINQHRHYYTQEELWPSQTKPMQ